MDAARFAALWERCRVHHGGVDPRALYTRLADLYGEAHRRYHTPSHIDHCLEQFDLARAQIPGADAVEMALWFHDAVYDPGADDNERRSAQLFRKWAGDVIDPALADDVCRLILATEHRELPWSSDEKYVVDIDLSGLGLPWPLFFRESEAVRAEFVNLAEEVLMAAQGRFLRSLLERGSIYATQFFRERYESRARRNITRYLAAMDDAGG